jgi:hypothetical protein
MHNLYDFLGMAASKEGITREEYIAYYGSSNESMFIDSYADFKALNEVSTDSFNPPKIRGNEKLNMTFFKKLMPRTAKTVKEATDRIMTWAGGTMFTHFQYMDVKPNGNSPDRPQYRIHNSQYWLNETQLGWAGRPGEKVNVTLLSIDDWSQVDPSLDPRRDYREIDKQVVKLGQAFVDTTVYLAEHRIIFEELNHQS